MLSAEDLLILIILARALKVLTVAHLDGQHDILKRQTVALAVLHMPGDVYSKGQVLSFCADGLCEINGIALSFLC